MSASSRGPAGGPLRDLLPPLVLLLGMAAVLLRRSVDTSPLPVLRTGAAVAGWLVLAAAGLGIGAPIVRVLGPGGRGERGPSPWLVIPVGLGGIVALAGLAAQVGGFRWWLLDGLVLLGALAGLREVRGRAGAGPVAGQGPGLPGWILAGALGFVLLAVTVPAPFYDQWNYHLAFPWHWLRAGRVVPFPRHAYSFFPAAAGFLFACGMPAGMIWPAQVVNAFLGILAAGGAFAIARLLGAGKGAWWSAAFVATTPAVLRMATWATADLGVAAFGTAACLALLLPAGPAGASWPRRWWLLAGLLAGLAVSCKYLALLTVALPLGLLLVADALPGIARGTTRPGDHATRLLAWGTGILLAFGPWAWRNFRWTGNPFHPFLGSLFGSPGTAPVAGRIAKSPWAWHDPLNVLTLGTFHPAGEAGSVGPVLLALLPAWLVLLALRRFPRREALLLVAVASGVAGWGFVHQLPRYLVPSLVLLAGALGPAWEGVTARLSRWPRWTLTGLLVFALAWGAVDAVDRRVLGRMAVALGREDADEFLGRWVSCWPGFLWVDRHLPPGARVLLVGEPRSLGLARDVVVEDPFRPPLLLELAGRAGSAERLAEMLRRRGITHLLYNRHEAQRIARAAGRPGYFAAGTEEARIVVRDFFRACVRPLAARGTNRVFRLEDRCRRPASRPPGGPGPAARTRETDDDDPLP